MFGLTEAVHRAAYTSPETTATICRNRERSWSEFKDRVARLAGGLQAIGVRPNDKVAILALNSDYFFEYYFATWWLGAVVVPMNIRWSSTENAYALNDSESVAILVDEVFKEQIPELLECVPLLQTVICFGSDELPDVEQVHRYETLIETSDAIADSRRGNEDIAGIFYTGGTTGYPKGVMVPHRALWYNGLVYSKYAHMEAQTRYLRVGPMFHIAECATSIGLTMVAGTHVILPSFTPESVMKAVEDHQITLALFVPTMINMLLAAPDFDAARLDTLEYVVYGGSPISEGLLKQLIGALPDIKLINSYGQTELGPVVSFLPPESHVLHGPAAQKLKSAGRVAAGVEIRIVDENDTEVGVNQVGEILARSAGTMTGYFKKPELTDEVLTDGWIRTGDGGRMDEDGFLFIVDRIKDMIITGGENVFSSEVENVISTCPGVAEVAVIGIPDEKWGEAVHAIVVPATNAVIDKDAIIQRCRELIAHYKVPRSIEIRTESLPVTAAGKTLKRELKKPYWDESPK